MQRPVNLKISMDSVLVTLSGADKKTAKKHKNSVHKHNEFNVDGNVGLFPRGTPQLNEQLLESDLLMEHT